MEQWFGVSRYGSEGTEVLSFHKELHYKELYVSGKHRWQNANIKISPGKETLIGWESSKEGGLTWAEWDWVLSTSPAYKVRVKWIW